jgi:hypothetical protein
VSNRGRCQDGRGLWPRCRLRGGFSQPQSRNAPEVTRRRRPGHRQRHRCQLARPSCLRCHAHHSRRRPLQRAAGRAVGPRAGRADAGDRRQRAGRALARHPRTRVPRDGGRHIARSRADAESAGAVAHGILIFHHPPFRVSGANSHSPQYMLQRSRFKLCCNAADLNHGAMHNIQNMLRCSRFKCVQQYEIKGVFLTK